MQEDWGLRIVQMVFCVLDESFELQINEKGNGAGRQGKSQYLRAAVGAHTSLPPMLSFTCYLTAWINLESKLPLTAK